MLRRPGILGSLWLVGTAVSLVAACSPGGGAGAGGASAGGSSTSSAQGGAANTSSIAPLDPQACDKLCTKSLALACRGWSDKTQAVCVAECTSQANACSAQPSALASYFSCLLDTPMVCGTITDAPSSPSCVKQGLAVAGCLLATLLDAGPGVAPDAATDAAAAPVDAGHDAAADAGPTVPQDAAADATTGVDASPDASTDSGIPGVVDASVDAATDASVDASTPPAVCPPAPTLPASTVLVANQSYPENVLVDDQHIFFYNKHTAQVMRANKDGTAPTVLYSTGAYGDWFVQDGAYLYAALSSKWVMGQPQTGSVVRIAKDGSGNVEVRKGLKPLIGIEVDATNVYWTTYTDFTNIYYASKGDVGGTSVNVISVPQGTSMIQHMVSQGGYLYWMQPTSNSPSVTSILRTSIASPGIIETVVATPTAAAISHFAVANGYAYFGETGYTYQVMQVPVAGGLPVALSRDGVGGWEVAVDGTSVFFVDGTNPGNVARASASGGVVTKLAQKQAAPTVPAVDGNYIYWANNSDAMGGSLNANTVMRQPKLADYGDCPLDESKSRIVARGQFDDTSDLGRLAVNASGVYWSNYWHRRLGFAPMGGGALVQVEGVVDPAWPEGIVATDTLLLWADRSNLVQSQGRLMKREGSSAPVALVQQSNIDPTRVAADGTDVYFSSSGDLWTVPLAGGSPQRLATNTAYIEDVVADSSGVWWGSDAVRTLPKGADGGAAPVVVSPSGSPWAMTQTATHVYWADSNGSSIWRVSKTAQDASAAEKLFTGLVNPRGIAVDAQFIYWTEIGSGTLKRAALGSTTAEVLVSGLVRPSSLAATDTQLFWLDTMEGTVRVVNKDGTVPPR